MELTGRKLPLETNKMHAVIQALSDKGSIITRIDAKEQILNDWFIEVMIDPLTHHVVPETLKIVQKHLSNWCNSSIAELVITCVENKVISEYLTPSATLKINDGGLTKNIKKARDDSPKSTDTPDSNFSIIGIRDSCHVTDVDEQSKLETANLFPDWADKYQEAAVS